MPIQQISEKSIFALVIDYYYLCNKNCLIREYRCKHREGSVSKSLPLILFSSDYQIYILDSHFCHQKASLNMSEGWERSLTVSCLNDGGMGSMKLYMSLPPKEIISTIFVSECSFKDSDGIDVLASLYLDQDHEICEVDIWKADFSPLIRISSDISL